MFSKKSHNDSNTSYNDPNASTYGTGSGYTDNGRGPHKSSLLNKLDPRVDSSTGQQNSGDTRNDGGALGTSPRHGNTGYGTSNAGRNDTTGYDTGNAGYASGTTGRNTAPTNAGPHDSNLANKIDPRVDSDMDRNNARMSRDSGYTTQHNSGYSNPSSNSGYGVSHPTSGPHSSQLANKADPRVDSDNSRSNYGNTSGNYGSNTTSTGYGNSGSTATGPHSSNLANKADPRVDSDNSRSNYGNTSSGYNNPGTGNNYGSSHGDSTNAGPHKSNLMNKLDPRVDSNMDGSRNAGMGQGLGNSNTGMMPQEISSHGHATGPPPGALEGRHAKHTAGNVTNATASASVSGGMVPEGSANASGPTSADAGTTTSNQGALKGAMRNLGSDHNNFGHTGHHQGDHSHGGHPACPVPGCGR